MSEKIADLKISKDEKPKLDQQDKMNTRVLTDVGYITVVRLDEINPYDSSHFPFGDKRWKDIDKIAKKEGRETWTEKSHIEGIQLCKKKIEDGYTVRPLLVFQGFRRHELEVTGNVVDWRKIKYQRLDGFKRYMALKELGYEYAVVQIVSSWVGGGQDGQSWVL